MPTLQKVSGLILKKTRTRENDQSIVIFTKELGKIMVFARGAQKLTSKRLGALDTLNFVRLVVWEKEHFFTLREATIISVLSSIKNDYEKKKHLLLLVEIIDKLTSFNQQDDKLFSFMKHFLVTDEEELMNESLLFDKMMQLLAILGYSLPPNTIPSWTSLERYLEGLSERNLLSREL